MKVRTFKITTNVVNIQSEKCNPSATHIKMSSHQTLDRFTSKLFTDNISQFKLKAVLHKIIVQIIVFVLLRLCGRLIFHGQLDECFQKSRGPLLYRFTLSMQKINAFLRFFNDIN